MLYITIVTKPPLYLTILFLFFNKIQKNKLIYVTTYILKEDTYYYISENSTIEVTEHD